MKIVVVNYGGDNFTPFARLNTKCAYKYGGVDHVYTYTPDDIDVEFRKKHAEILSSSLGGGIGFGNLISSKKPYPKLKMVTI